MSDLQCLSRGQHSPFKTSAASLPPATDTPGLPQLASPLPGHLAKLVSCPFSSSLLLPDVKASQHTVEEGEALTLAWDWTLGPSLAAGNSGLGLKSPHR